MTHRILHIVSSLDCFGTAKQMLLLAAGLPREEFEIHIAALDPLGPASETAGQLGFEPVSMQRRGTLDAMAFWRLREHVRKLRPALVHTWQFDANSYGRAAAISGKVPRIVATERHIDRWKSTRHWAIDRKLARRTDRMVVNSPAVRDFYTSAGIPPAKFTLVPSAVWSPQAEAIPKTALLEQFRLPSEAKLIAFLGPLSIDKRIKELIWATDQLKAVGLRAHLLIFGDGPLRSRLERYSRLNRTDDRVHFLGSRTDAANFLPHVDVLWQSGIHEGHSCAILEAMAAGVPVVAADTPGNRELVAPQETGYLAPVGERAAFARWTLPLLENAELAGRMGLAGKERVRQHHLAAVMCEAHARLYRELLD
ncbi:MAG TPA: glycosyltransferase [Pirellulales bacterium]